MKFFFAAAAIAGLFLLVFNLTQMDWISPLSSSGLVTLIGALASVCVILVCLLLLLSFRIYKKLNQRK